MDLLRYRPLQTDIRRPTRVFTAQISHEIRAPINTIIRFAEALKAGVRAGDPARVDGHVGFSSRPGQGAEFWVDLPHAPAQAAPIQSDSVETVSDAGSVGRYDALGTG